MNIVFIGMPGSGKTTIGKIIAEKINKNFFDLDKYIEQEEKMSIKGMFKNGEDYFRNLEYKYLKIISNKNNVVIATGGGVVETEDSINIIKKDYVIFLNRNLEDIISNITDDTRPLLVGDVKLNLHNIYKRRIKKYLLISDYTVNVTDIKSTVIKILNHLKEEGII